MKGLINKSKGFTLIELMVVMTILSVLAGIVIPAVTGTTTAGRGTTMTADINTVQNAVERFVGDHPKGVNGGWPTCEGTLPNTSTDPSVPIVWGASFVSKDNGITVRVFGSPATLTLATASVPAAVTPAKDVLATDCSAILTTETAASTTAKLGASYLRAAVPHSAATRADFSDLTSALTDGGLKIKVKAFANKPNTKLTVTHEIEPDTDWSPVATGKGVWRIDHYGKVLVTMNASEY